MFSYIKCSFFQLFMFLNIFVSFKDYFVQCMIDYRYVCKNTHICKKPAGVIYPSPTPPPIKWQKFYFHLLLWNGVTIKYNTYVCVFVFEGKLMTNNCLETMLLYNITMLLKSTLKRHISFPFVM